jgi:transposase-like protein
MPKTSVVGENVKARAIKLRSKGYSYREIARELGVSVSTVFRLVKGVGRTPKPVSAMSIDSGDTEFRKILRGVAFLTLLEIYNTKRIDEVEELLKWLWTSASLRLAGDFRCARIDSSGFCTIYQVNVTDNPLLCIACPLYTPLYLLKKRRS